MTSTAAIPNGHTESLGCLSHAAIVFFIVAALLTANGVRLGGWPEPGQVAPIHPRKSYEVDESRWRQCRARETNDLTLWNEKAQLVLLFPPHDRAERQDEMVRDGWIPESARLRILTPEEQVEMENHVLSVRTRNQFMEFRMAWALLGLPLSFLATLLSVFAFDRALGRRVSGLRLGLLTALIAVNLLNLLLTWWNFSGTSFD